MKKGTFIVVDGNDGSGKATQVAQMIQRLEAEGQQVRTIDFPQYESFFGKMIADGQSGEFGDWTKMNPKMTSVFYAADRQQADEHVRQWIDKGYIVIADRYVSANQIHQGGKISDSIERRDFMRWLSKLEYEVFEIARPDVVIYLDIDTEFTLENLQKKKPELYKENRQDQTETDRTYAENSRECGLWLAQQSNSWEVIKCSPDGSQRSIDDIHEEMYGVVGKYL